MPSKILYASDFYKIEIDTFQNVVKTKWLRPVKLEEMKTGSTRLFESLQQTNAERLVANAELLSSLDSETKEWMATSLYELISRTNVKKIARVLPQNVFTKLALESVATRAEASGKANFVIGNFSAQQEAEKWVSA